MSLPTLDEVLRPILAMAAKQEITRRSAITHVIELFNLCEEDQRAHVPSGAPRINLRTSWAMTFLTKAGLIEKAAKNSYRATKAGRQFLDTHPDKITEADLKGIDGWEEAWEAGRKRLARHRERQVSRRRGPKL